MTTAEAIRTYRRIPFHHGACTVCDEVKPLTQHHKVPSVVNQYGVRHKPYLLPVHGPRNDRCPGGHTEPKAWLEATSLPTWEEMSDLDRGAALMFTWKVYRERDRIYARENYPARYVDHPLLTALDLDDQQDRGDACRHATAVCGTWVEARDRWGADEVQRMYDLTLNHKRGA